MFLLELNHIHAEVNYFIAGVNYAIAEVNYSNAAGDVGAERSIIQMLHTGDVSAEVNYSNAT